MDARRVEAADVGAADAGIIDQDVQLAVAVHRLGNCVRPLVGVGNIQVYEGCLPAQFADLGFQFRTFII